MSGCFCYVFFVQVENFNKKTLISNSTEVINELHGNLSRLLTSLVCYFLKFAFVFPIHFTRRSRSSRKKRLLKRNRLAARHFEKSGGKMSFFFEKIPDLWAKWEQTPAKHLAWHSRTTIESGNSFRAGGRAGRSAAKVPREGACCSATALPATGKIFTPWVKHLERKKESSTRNKHSLPTQRDRFVALLQLKETRKRAIKYLRRPII